MSIHTGRRTMNSTENKSLRDDFTNASEYNKLEFIIERKIRDLVNTAALVRVDACTSTGPQGPAGTVSATPLVSQTDAEGNALPMASIPRMPHGRVQGGVAALIIDPVPGDIGVAVFCKDDSSGVEPGATRPQAPASFRQYSQSDGMLAATVSNQAPQVWIELKQDKTVIIHAPEGCLIETDKTVEIKAAESVKLNTPLVEISGVIRQTGEAGAGKSSFVGGFDNTGGAITSNGITLETHTHTGVEPGGGSSGQPQ